MDELINKEAMGENSSKTENDSFQEQKETKTYEPACDVETESEKPNPMSEKIDNMSSVAFQPISPNETELEKHGNPVSQKKNNKRLIFLSIVAICILAVLGAIFLGITHNQKLQGESIITALKAGNIDQAIELYEQANKTVIERYNANIEDEFSSLVFSNKYSFGSVSSGLVAEDQFDSYSKYLKFSEVAGYSEDNKAVRYVKTVLKLKDFAKYNNIITLVYNITDDYQNFLYYFKASMNSSSSSLYTYHQKGKEYMESIYREANKYTGYLCMDFKTAAQEIYMWYETIGDAVSTQSFVESKNKIEDIISDVTNAMGEISDIKKILESY